MKTKIRQQLANRKRRCARRLDKTNVPGFAASGDLVWVVRYSILGSGVSQEMWISSTTGAVRTMLPVRKHPK